MSGPKGQESDFIDVHELNSLITGAWEAIMQKDQLQPQAQLWLGETASGWSDGTNGLSNAFIDGFM